MSESVDNGGDKGDTTPNSAANPGSLPAPTAETVATFLRDLLAGIITRMGLTAQVDVSEDPETILLEVSGTSADELVAGRRGSVLDAMQYYLGKVLGHHGLRGKRVLIDAGGFREERRKMLRNIALELTNKVRTHGRAIAVEPMSAYDRRIIHLACADTEGVSTRSEGEGEERRLIVLPGDAPRTSTSTRRRRGSRSADAGSAPATTATPEPEPATTADEDAQGEPTADSDDADSSGDSQSDA